MPSLNEILSRGITADSLNPTLRRVIRGADVLKRAARPLMMEDHDAAQYGPSMISASDMVEMPGSLADAGLIAAGALPLGKVAKAVSRRAKSAKGVGVAENFEEAFNYSGPREQVPFPQYDWRKYDFIVPGVDAAQAQREGKRVKVALSDLNATQGTVRQIDLAHVTADKSPPVVVKKGGKLWIQDGHHRLAQAFKRGDRDASVIVVDKDH